jgi:hypothetical protein
VKTLLRLCVGVLFCIRLVSAQTNAVVDRVTAPTAGSNTLHWTFPSQSLSTQPSWDPVTQEVPLSPHAAVKAATEFLHKKGQPTDDLRVRRIILSLEDQSKWMYWIHFSTSSVMVNLDGTIVEPSFTSTNATPEPVTRRVPVRRETATAANTAGFSMAGAKGSYEIVETKVIKAFAVDDGGAKFCAYLVRWKDYDVVVADPLGKTDMKEGDTITITVNRSELPVGGSC